LKATRGEVTYLLRSLIRLTNNFLQRDHGCQRKWNDIFKVLKEKSLKCYRPRNLYLTKHSFKTEEVNKTFDGTKAEVFYFH
jgi:hypothetical protein